MACCDRARGWGVPDGAVPADAGYGRVTPFREGLEARRLSYVVEVDGTLSAETTPQSRQPVPYAGRGAPPQALVRRATPGGPRHDRRLAPADGMADPPVEAGHPAVVGEPIRCPAGPAR